ncbi:unnamed protein product [Ambrosiozyma monospora]|uniref:Unnamed protein product n=1 Tax=Ambrosiozyma monospora TaxID=43982 RepID=A0ACB5UBN0_AMBMO|nr:unnamed protein product [Ambrosiozyma monospora]
MRTKNIKQEAYYPSWGIIYECALLNYQIISKTRSHTNWSFISNSELMYLFHSAKTMLYFIDVTNDEKMKTTALGVVRGALEVLRNEAMRSGTSKFLFQAIIELFNDKSKRKLLIDNLCGDTSSVTNALGGKTINGHSAVGSTFRFKWKQR